MIGRYHGNAEEKQGRADAIEPVIHLLYPYGEITDREKKRRHWFCALRRIIPLWAKKSADIMFNKS